MISEGNFNENSEGPKETFVGNEWVLESDLHLISGAEEELQRRLQTLGWDENDIFPLMLSLRELIANAVAHGNQGLRSQDDSHELMDESIRRTEQHFTDKKVHVTLDLGPDESIIMVRDEGQGFIPQGQDEQAVSEDGMMRENGRGYFIMKSMLDHINYEIGENGGTIVTIKHKRKTK